MSKDKCSNCKSTDSKTFWTFEDNTVLCDKCHKECGDEWQEEIEHNTKHINKNTIEGHKQLKKNTWIIVVLIVFLLIAGFDDANKQTKIKDTQTQLEDTTNCLDDCNSEYGDTCSSTTSAGDSYSDILTDNEDLQDCIDEFSSCVDDCKTTLEDYKTTLE